MTILFCEYTVFITSLQLLLPTDIIIKPVSLPQGPRRQPREDNAGSGGSGGHVCVAGPRLGYHTGLHH